MKKDVVVIGGGIAGITSALLFSEKGKSVLLITDKWTTLFASGLFDLFIPPDENPSTGGEALRSLFKNHRHHILARLLRRREDLVWEGLHFLSSLYPFFSLLKKGDERFSHYISDMGTFKKSWGGLRWIATVENLEGGGEKFFIWPRGLMGRRAEMLSAIMRRFTGIDFRAVEVDTGCKSYYEFFNNPEEKIKIISRIKGRNALFLLPPLFCGDYGGAHGCCEVFPTLESLNGLWMKEVLLDMMRKKGVEIREEKVKDIRILNGKAVRVIAEKEEIEADLFVLATGKFLGDSWNLLMRFLTTNKGRKTSSALLTNPHPFHSQAFFSIGLEVDEKMRVLDREGNKIGNFLACGSLISNVDPFAWSMGMGFSALTAYLLYKFADEL